MIHPDDLDMVEKSIAEQVSEDEEGLDRIDYRIIRKDGKIRWWMTTGICSEAETVTISFTFLWQIQQKNISLKRTQEYGS